MRIISGQYRGRRLLTPPGKVTRPMTDRVKESLFATIADWLDGAAVADLFCGTGTAGLEALSRGAAHAWFADRDREALDRLRRNIEALNAGDRSTIWGGDILRRLTRWLTELEHPLDIVLLDPPYPMARQWFAETTDRATIERAVFAPVADALAADGLVVLRTPADLAAPDRLATLRRRRHRVYGSTALNYYQHAPDAAALPYHSSSPTAEDPSMATSVQVNELPDYQGQPTFRIDTPAATWYYHKTGGGFASLIDPEGRDWISFRPTGGSDGAYRGIPNLVHPAGYFHPGGDGCESRITQANNDRVVIESTAERGRWSVRWEITTLWAHLTVQAAPEPYWFLYEGTPGGNLDEVNEFCLRSRGIRTPAGESWDEVLAHPKWVAFGAPAAGRTLLLVHHDGGDEVDSYWPMEHNMTVFGFGRRKLDKFLTGADRRFTVQLVGAALDDAIHAAVTAALSVPEA